MALGLHSLHCEQFGAVLFEPLFGLGGVRGVAVDQSPEGRTVVGVGQMAEFVDADVFADPVGRADQPPVEFDAGLAAADTPEGFGAAEGNGGRMKVQALRLRQQLRQQRGLGLAVEQLVQGLPLFWPVALRQEKGVAAKIGVSVFVCLQGQFAAEIPNFRRPACVGRRRQSEHTQQAGFVGG